MVALFGAACDPEALAVPVSDDCARLILIEVPENSYVVLRNTSLFQGFPEIAMFDCVERFFEIYRSRKTSDREHVVVARKTCFESGLIHRVCLSRERPNASIEYPAE